MNTVRVKDKTALEELVDVIKAQSTTRTDNGGGGME
jgi:hypothetical protein